MKKIAVVTGASSGVGRAVAIKLAESGWDVALIARWQRGMEETTQQAAGFNQRLHAFACDVSSESEVRDTTQRIQTEIGTPTVLVNSAGMNVPRRALSELSFEDFQKVISVNLTGAFLLTQALLPAMRAIHNGTIVNIVSDAGLFANSISGAAYVASKFGLIGLTDTINIEERKNGIRACAICPGPINTPLLDKRPNPPAVEARLQMLQPQDVVDCIMLAINLPPRAILQRLLIMPR